MQDYLDGIVQYKILFISLFFSFWSVCFVLKNWSWKKEVVY